MSRRPFPRLSGAALAACAALTAPAAHAAVSCSLSASAVNVSLTGATNNSGATITLSCTRLSGDPNSQSYWVGISPAAGNARRLFRHGGGTGTGDRLDASLFKNNTTTNWTDSGSGRVSGTLAFGAALTASTTLDYDFRISSQSGKSAGIYDAVYTAGLQLTTNGAQVASATFSPTANVPTQCFVGQVASGNTAPGAVSPSAISLAYTSFAATAQTGNMTFTVDCTLNTAYQLALSPASGTLLGLNYSVQFGNGSATWSSLTGAGLAQAYTVTATVPAGQAGTCASATCSGTRATTITITY